MSLKQRIRSRTTMAVLAASLINTALASMAKANFLENFDNPQSPDGYVAFTGDPVYLTTVDYGSTTGANSIGNVHENANIVQSYLNITNDQSGSGYFLFDGTVNDGTNYTGMVWETINPTPVTKNTDYVYSFYLTNLNNISNAAIEPYIDGDFIGGPVSANGVFGDGNSADEWQQFSFNWNSGANTTADLGLYNLTSTGLGNDFGIDTISLTSVPEPASTGLTVFGATALLAMRRRKRL